MGWSTGNGTGSGGGSGVTDVANLAALDALSVTNLDDGALAWVDTLRAEWVLVTGDIPTEDAAICRVSDDPLRYWSRRPFGHYSWADQATWYISDGGNIEASGTSDVVPVPGAEFSRRLQGFSTTNDMTLNLVGNVSAGVIRVRIGAFNDFTIDGSGHAVTETGAVTASTAQVQSTNTRQQTTAPVAWNVNRIYKDANTGKKSWAIGSSGVNASYTKFLTTSNTSYSSLGTPAVADVINGYDLYSLTPDMIDVDGDSIYSTLIIKQVILNGASLHTEAIHCQFEDCYIADIDFHDVSYMTFKSCQMNIAAPADVFTGSMEAYNCWWKRGVYSWTEVFLGGCHTFTGNSSGLDIGTGQAYSLSAGDYELRSYASFQLEYLGALSMNLSGGYLWGDPNTCFIRLAPGSKVYYNDSTRLLGTPTSLNGQSYWMIGNYQDGGTFVHSSKGNVVDLPVSDAQAQCSISTADSAPVFINQVLKQRPRETATYPNSTSKNETRNYVTNGHSTSSTTFSLDSFTPDVSTVTDVVVTIVGIKSDETVQIKQDIEACFRTSSGGAVVEMGTNTTSTTKSNGTTTGYALSIDTSGGAIRLRVTTPAAGGTFEWTANVTVIQRSIVT